MQLGCSEPRHVRHPRALLDRPAPTEERQSTLTFVLAQDLGRSVRGVVVGGDDVVDSPVEVEADLVADDVRLVANQQRHDDPHRPSALMRSSSSSTRCWSWTDASVSMNSATSETNASSVAG